MGFLAGRIGPREATSASYARAARWVADRRRAYGYRVRRQVLRVPSLVGRIASSVSADEMTSRSNCDVLK